MRDALKARCRSRRRGYIDNVGMFSKAMIRAMMTNPFLTPTLWMIA
jgi:hypothetical protein